MEKNNGDLTIQNTPTGVNTDMHDMRTHIWVEKDSCDKLKADFYNFFMKYQEPPNEEHSLNNYCKSEMVEEAEMMFRRFYTEFKRKLHHPSASAVENAKKLYEFLRFAQRNNARRIVELRTLYPND